MQVKNRDILGNGRFSTAFALGSLFQDGCLGPRASTGEAFAATDYVLAERSQGSLAEWKLGWWLRKRCSRFEKDIALGIQAQIEVGQPNRDETSNEGATTSILATRTVCLIRDPCGRFKAQVCASLAMLVD